MDVFNRCLFNSITLGWPMDDNIGWQFRWHFANVCVGHFWNYCHFLFLWIGKCVHWYEIYDRTYGYILLAYLLARSRTIRDVSRVYLFKYYDETVNIFRFKFSNRLSDNWMEYIWICNATIAIVVHLVLYAKQWANAKSICYGFQKYTSVGTTISNRSKWMDEISRRDETTSTYHCQRIRTFKIKATIQFGLWTILKIEYFKIKRKKCWSTFVWFYI